MERAFSGDAPALEGLRSQLDVAVVQSRELTGVGFFTDFELPENAVAVRFRRTCIVYGDVQARIDGLQHGAGLVIFITAGILEALEGFSYGEPWPNDTDTFELSEGPNANAGLSELG